MHNIQAIFAANFPVNTPLSTLGLTALHFAATNSNYYVMQLILQCHADVNVEDTMGRRPLHLAAASGNSNCVILLLN